MRRILVSLVVCSLLLLGCSSDDKKPDGPKEKKRPVAETEVPKPVTTAFAAAHPTGKANQWFARGKVYSVRGEDSGKWIEIKFAEDGALQEEADEVAVDATPDPVKKAFSESAYAKMTFVDAVKRTNPSKDPKVLYKFVVTDGTKNVIAVYGTDGKLVKEKPFEQAKLDKWKAEHTVAR